MRESGGNMDSQNFVYYTVEDLENQPDGNRSELIDGRIYHMNIPSRKHQELVGELYGLIWNHVHNNDCRCKPFVAPFSVYLNQDNRNYVQPDICMVSDQNKLNEKGCAGVPDMIVEVASPESLKMDYVIKLLKYASAGVQEYWIVDYMKSRITVYDFKEQEMNEYTFSDCVPVKLYPGLVIDFTKIKIMN